MIRREILPENEPAFKANMHSHTTCSDGVLTPREAKELYKGNGYSILAYTDHHTYHNQTDMSDESFLAISGYELNFDLFDANGGLTKTCHMNAIARDPDRVYPIEGRGLYSIDAINDAIKQLRNNGFIVNLNHPSWSNQSPEDVVQLEGFTAIELYNSGCARTYNIGESQLHYDAYLKAGKKSLMVFADDNHASCRAFSPYYSGGYHAGYEMPSRGVVTRVASMDSCLACVWIYSRELSYRPIMDSLMSGRYYCSTGPSISKYYVEDDTIHLACSPARAVFLKTKAWGISSSLMDPNGSITNAEFDLGRLRENSEEFFRIEIVDSNGDMAFTNPYYLSEL